MSVLKQGTFLTFFVHCLCFISQKRSTTRKNEELFGQDQIMRVELSTLKSEPPTPTNIILMEAAAFLGLPDYERFKSYLHRAYRDYAIEDICDPESGDIIGAKVCSVRFPDAPPRLFLFDSNSRCLCKERVAHEGMCPHEIRVHGFDKNKFEERHSRRLRVTGSLTGWSPPSETKSPVDGIIGFEPEELCTSFESSLAIQPSCPPCPPCPALPSIKPPLFQPPPGFLPDKSSKVKPFGKKQVSNMFNDALAKYPSLDENTKFRMNGLLMEIQSLVNSDPMGATVDHGSGKMAIEVPSQQFVVSQTKGRIMSLNEKKQRSINKSTNFNPGGSFCYFKIIMFTD